MLRPQLTEFTCEVQQMPTTIVMIAYWWRSSSRTVQEEEQNAELESTQNQICSSEERSLSLQNLRHSNSHLHRRMAIKWFRNVEWTKLHLLVSVAILLQLTPALCHRGKVSHVVGGEPNTWSVQKNPHFYQNWAFGQRFTVGDELVFILEENMTTPYTYKHNVIQFPDNKAFLKCDPQGGMNFMSEALESETPTTVVVDLPAPGVFYYGCSKHEYCLHGQKFFIKVWPRT